MESLSTSESDPSWWRWLAQTYRDAHHFAPHSQKVCWFHHPRYLFENCPYSMKPYSSQIWRIPMIVWHRAQLVVVDKSYMQRTQRSCLTSRLLCVWLAVSNLYFPVLSRKPSESVTTKISTAHISKTKTNFSKIPSKTVSGLHNLGIEINLSRRFSWPLTTKVESQSAWC